MTAVTERYLQCMLLVACVLVLSLDLATPVSCQGGCVPPLVTPGYMKPITITLCSNGTLGLGCDTESKSTNATLIGDPEKAGVGGPIPSLATNNFNNLAIAKNIQKSARVQYAYIGLPYGLFRADRFK